MSLRAWLALTLFAAVGCGDDDTTSRESPDAGGSTTQDAGGKNAERDVTVRFKAKVFDRDFACGQTYDAMGSTQIQVEPRICASTCRTSASSTPTATKCR